MAAREDDPLNLGILPIGLFLVGLTLTLSAGWAVIANTTDRAGHVTVRWRKVGASAVRPAVPKFYEESEIGRTTLKDVMSALGPPSEMYERGRVTLLAYASGKLVQYRRYFLGVWSKAGGRYGSGDTREYFFMFDGGVLCLRSTVRDERMRRFHDRARCQRFDGVLLDPAADDGGLERYFRWRRLRTGLSWLDVRRSMGQPRAVYRLGGLEVWSYDETFANPDVQPTLYFESGLLVDVPHDPGPDDAILSKFGNWRARFSPVDPSR